MTAKSKAREPRSRKPSSSNHITERICQRSYELYEQRGRLDGFALDDWLQAEAEVLGAKKHGSGAQLSVKSLKYKRDLEKGFGRRAIHYRCGLPMHHVPRLVHGPSRRPDRGPPAPPAVGTGRTSRFGRQRKQKQRRETNDELQAPSSNRRTGKAMRDCQGIQSAKWYAAESRQRCRARRVCLGGVRR